MIREIEIMKHALGVDSPRPFYRNYFAAGTDDVGVCNFLVERGYMQLTRGPSETFPDPLYEVTALGRVIIEGIIAAEADKQGRSM